LRYLALRFCIDIAPKEACKPPSYDKVTKLLNQYLLVKNSEKLCVQIDNARKKAVRNLTLNRRRYQRLVEFTHEKLWPE